MRAIEFLINEVRGDHLYHYTNAGAAVNILRTGYIKAGAGSQLATKAQTKLPTVSVTRDWAYATGKSGNDSPGQRMQDVVFILDRKKIENNYKTIGTSQSDDTRAGAFNTLRPAKRDHIRSVSPGGEKYKQIDTDNDRSISQDEFKAFQQMAHAGDKSELAKHQNTWASIVNHGRRKAGKEYEEVIPVKSGKLPLKNILVGVYSIPGGDGENLAKNLNPDDPNPKRRPFMDPIPYVDNRP
jgi:hypothetical protein|tara:strand:- start:503 stop:1222 length:720 start_codon:yes stop_codon:yes gene_type:complete